MPIYFYKILAGLHNFSKAEFECLSMLDLPLWQGSQNNPNFYNADGKKFML